MYNLKLNDTIKWASAAGNLTGTIVEIFLCLNAAQVLVPWARVEVQEGIYKQRTVLNLLPENMAMLKIAKV